MTIYRSPTAQGLKTQSFPGMAGAVCVATETIAIPANATNADIFEIASLPGGARLVDFMLDVTDMDTGGAPSAIFKLGVMSGVVGSGDNARTCNDALAAGLNTAQAGGFVRAAKGLSGIGVTDAARGIGLQFTTAPATRAAGTATLTLFYTAG